MNDNDVDRPDESEILDQLQPDDTLLDRGVADTLDEGYVTGEKWSPATGFGNTPAERRRGETLEMRLAQEEPEPDASLDPDDWDPDGDTPREVGDRRAGRLMDRHGQGLDDVSDVYGSDVGIDGGAASAEEAAMHVIDPWADAGDR